VTLLGEQFCTEYQSDSLRFKRFPAVELFQQFFFEFLGGGGETVRIASRFRKQSTSAGWAGRPVGDGRLGTRCLTVSSRLMRGMILKLDTHDERLKTRTSSALASVLPLLAPRQPFGIVWAALCECIELTALLGGSIEEYFLKIISHLVAFGLARQW